MDLAKMSVMSVEELFGEYEKCKKRGSRNDLVRSLCRVLSKEKLEAFLAKISPNGESNRWVSTVKHELGRRAEAIFKDKSLKKPKTMVRANKVA